MSQYSKLTDVYVTTVEPEKTPLSSDDTGIRLPNNDTLRHKRRRAVIVSLIFLALLVGGITAGLLAFLRHHNHKKHCERFEFEVEYEPTNNVIEVVEVFENETITQTTELLNQTTLYLYEKKKKIVRDETTCHLMDHTNTFDEDKQQLKEMKLHGRKVETRTMLYKERSSMTREELLIRGGKNAFAFCGERTTYITEEHELLSEEVDVSLFTDFVARGHQLAFLPLTESGEVEDTLSSEDHEPTSADYYSGDDALTDSTPQRSVRSRRAYLSESDLQLLMRRRLLGGFNVLYYNYDCFGLFQEYRGLHGSGDVDNLFHSVLA